VPVSLSSTLGSKQTIKFGPIQSFSDARRGFRDLVIGDLRVTIIGDVEDLTRIDTESEFVDEA
jgi:hypothetical protein